MTEGKYELVKNWPKYPPGSNFEMGSGVAVDNEGIIYLLIREIEHWAQHPLAMSSKMGKGAVWMFDREGNYLGKWGKSDEPGFTLGAHTLYIIDNDFWVIDRDGHTVRRYDKAGELTLSLGTFAKPGDGPNHFNGPTGLVVQPNGNIVISDGYWNSRLVWFSPEGKYLKEIGGWGNGPGQFNSPHAVAQTPDGRLFVVDYKGGAMHPYVTVEGQIAEERKRIDPDRKSRIQIFDGDGNFLEEWTHIVPLSIAVYGDRIYASDKMHHLAVLDAATGREIERYEDMAVWLHQIALDQHGDIYTATVYPEAGGHKRGPEGPSYLRWTRSAAGLPAE